MPNETKSSSGAGAAAPLAVGPLWFIGWLFTIGFAELSFWEGVLALVVWPYFLGIALR